MKYVILGISDEIDTCDCCGKFGLKRTVAMTQDGQEVQFFGTTCAANKLNEARGYTYCDGRDVANLATSKSSTMQAFVRSKALAR